MSQDKKCLSCGEHNNGNRYFCTKCGSFLDAELFKEKNLYNSQEIKLMRILENIDNVPHSKVVWNDVVDLYTKKIEQCEALMRLPDINSKNDLLFEKMNVFLKMCRKPEFQIAFVGVIKTGKSTLINSLLGGNYASVASSPETSVLTKFRYSEKDYIRVEFYSEKEWDKLWKTVGLGAAKFREKYENLNADKLRSKFVGKEQLYMELLNEEVEIELKKWTSAKSPEHFFVKEVEVGISTLSKEFPKEVVFVDTPGLGDPVSYRSDITKKYILEANAVFMCVDAKKLTRDEQNTIANVLSISANNKRKVYIIATHWDKLNRPIEHWRENKNVNLDILEGRGYFGDRKLADSNYIHSSAHIYNCCRDYEIINDNDFANIKQLCNALGMDYEDDYMDYLLERKSQGIDTKQESVKELAIRQAVAKYLSEIMKYCNIDYIKEVIAGNLISNYKKIFENDIEHRYIDILLSVKRVSNDNLEDRDKIIQNLRGDLENLLQEIEKKKEEIKDIEDAKRQLNQLMESMKKRNDKAREDIFKELDSIITRIKNDNK